jgi:hypothetical protein
MKEWNELDENEKEEVEYLVQSWGLTRENILSMGYFCIHVDKKNWSKVIGKLQSPNNNGTINYFIDSEDGQDYIGAYTPRDAISIMVLWEIVSGERNEQSQKTS